MNERIDAYQKALDHCITALWTIAPQAPEYQVLADTIRELRAFLDSLREK